jgi:hypothetical protein
MSIFPLWPRVTQTMTGSIQRQAQSLRSSIILHLSSVLRALCALVVNAFSFPSLMVLWRIFDDRPTTNDDRAWIRASVNRHPSAVLRLTPDA